MLSTDCRIDCHHRGDKETSCSLQRIGLFLSLTSKLKFLSGIRSKSDNTTQFFGIVAELLEEIHNLAVSVIYDFDW